MVSCWHSGVCKGISQLSWTSRQWAAQQPDDAARVHHHLCRERGLLGMLRASGTGEYSFHLKKNFASLNFFSFCSCILNRSSISFFLKTTNSSLLMCGLSFSLLLQLHDRGLLFASTEPQCVELVCFKAHSELFMERFLSSISPGLISTM